MAGITKLFDWRPPPASQSLQPIMSFMNHGTRASWSKQILAAVRTEYPRLLPADAE